MYLPSHPPSAFTRIHFIFHFPCSAKVCPEIDCKFNNSAKNVAERVQLPTKDQRCTWAVSGSTERVLSRRRRYSRTGHGAPCLLYELRALAVHQLSAVCPAAHFRRNFIHLNMNITVGDSASRYARALHFTHLPFSISGDWAQASVSDAPPVKMFTFYSIIVISTQCGLLLLHIFANYIKIWMHQPWIV